MPRSLSIIIPCYNEEEIIESTVERLRQEVTPIRPDFDLWLCNDGSTDGTGDKLAALARRFENVNCVGYFPNRGAGRAFRTGLENALGDVVMHMDADLAMEPGDVCRTLIPLLERHDVVIGSRYLDVRADYPLRRRIPSAVYRFLYRSLLGLDIQDAMSGFFGVKRAVLEHISPLESDGFEAYLELFVKAKQAGFSLAEVGIKFEHKTESGEISVLRHAPKQFANTVRLCWKLRVQRASAT